MKLALVVLGFIAGMVVLFSLFWSALVKVLDAFDVVFPPGVPEGIILFGILAFLLLALKRMR